MKNHTPNLKIIGHILAVLSLLFVGIKFSQNLDQMAPLRMDLNGSFACAVVVSAAILVGISNSYSWTLLIRSQSCHLKFRHAYVIYNQSSIAKYIPGNFFQYLGRLALSQNHRLPKSLVISSMAAEIFFSVSAVVIMGLAGLLLDFEGFIPLFDYLRKNDLLFPALALIAAVVFMFIFWGFRGRNENKMLLGRFFSSPGMIALIMMLTLLAFCLIGICAVYLVDTFWPGHAPLPWYRFIYGFALAWLAGFVVPGAPGGIGIREMVMISFFGASLGEGVIVGLAVLLRVLMTAGELLLFTSALLLRDKNRGNA